MFYSFKRQWKSLRSSHPGHRFQDRYESARSAKKKGSFVGRLIKIVGALVSFVIGVVLVFIPGPAILFFAIAGGLMATESLVVAKSLDWLEVKLRVVIRWGVKHWRRLHAIGKTAVVSGVALGAVGLAYVSYRVLTN